MTVPVQPCSEAHCRTGAIHPAIGFCCGFHDACGITAPGSTVAVPVAAVGAVVAAAGAVPWAVASALAKVVAAEPAG